MELLTASEYLHEFVELQHAAQQLMFAPSLLFTVPMINIPGLPTVLHAYYSHARQSHKRYLSREHKQLLLLEQCYCPAWLPRCFCMENQALVQWCWLKFATREELHAVAEKLAAYVENNFWF